MFMSIYEALAPIYDELFPQNPAATAFLLGLTGQKSSARWLPRRVLDIGCATASQLLDLAAAGWEAFGLEPSRAMRGRAMAKAERAGLALAISEGGMLDARGRFPKGHFGLLLCIGNTLPYLGSEEELREFLGGAASLLAPGASIVLQTLNYERALSLLRSEGFDFPELGASGSTFRRHYEEAQGGRLSFITEVFQDGQETAREASELSPFRPEALVKALRESGFEEPRARSGWGHEASGFSAASDGYLILTSKVPD
jgi:SAM-dependent methyltransferase